MRNAHPNAPTERRMAGVLRYQRPTHKQSIAIQTATDHVRHGAPRWPITPYHAGILKTMECDARHNWGPIRNIGPRRTLVRFCRHCGCSNDSIAAGLACRPC